MHVTSSQFITSAVQPSQYPETSIPEIAFAGRSNVGKSSLINTLLNRRRLVRTSGRPGRTQLINFFSINQAFNFVDLPGYGYARVPQAVKKTWGPMIERYLSERTALKGVVVILDIRRQPDEKDRQLIEWLAHLQRPQIIVLTKADKYKRGRQMQRRQAIAGQLDESPHNLLLFSAKSRLGKDALWDAIEGLIT
jgi:GTP-binding protein